MGIKAGDSVIGNSESASAEGKVTSVSPPTVEIQTDSGKRFQFNESQVSSSRKV